MKRLMHIWVTVSWSERLSYLFMVFFVMIALFAPFIASEGSIFVGFGPNSLSSSAESYQAPGFIEPDTGFRHWMGTDRLGRDVLACMIGGARTAFLVGLGSSMLSFLIALVLGVVSGYYGNTRVRLNVLQVLWLLLSLFVGVFYIIEFTKGVWMVFSALGLLLIVYYVLRVLGNSMNRKILVPFDTLIIKGIEIFNTIPGLFLVLALFAILDQPSIGTVVFIIGIISWPGKTRILRAEILRVKEENYIKSAEILGLSNWRIIRYHILPNTIAPLLVAVAFSFTSAILLESTLSFLNIGLPHDIPSWGSILRDARDYFPAWWLALFPGLALFFTILTLNNIVDGVNHSKF